MFTPSIPSSTGLATMIRSALNRWNGPCYELRWLSRLKRQARIST
jgi:hypothetical protein